MLWGLLFPAVGVFAADKVLDVSQLERDSIALTSYFALIEDPGGSLTLADVRTADAATRFAASEAEGEALSFGFTRSAYWLRLNLRNSSAVAVDRLLEIRYPLLSDIQLHRPLADGSYQSLATGAAMPFSTRPYANRFFVFPLTLPAHSDQVVYLRIQSASAMLIPASLWEPKAFHAYERDDYLAQVWYFGMAAAIILFNLLLFLALWDVVYLLYIVFAAGTSLTIAAGNGFGKEFLWPETMLWSNMAISVFGSLTLAALLLFMRRMLETRDNVPQLDRLIKVFIGLLLLFPIGSAISLHTFVVPGTILVAATGILILSVGIFCSYSKRHEIAALFVVAFSMWLLGVLLVSLKTISVLPANFLTMNGYQIGSALEMMLLAFVLAYRFNMIRRKATEDVRQANASLEDRLQAREAELRESHQRLREVEHRQILSQERQRLMQDMHDGMGSSLTSALRVVESGQMDKVDVAHVLKGCIDDLKLAIDSMEPVQADLLLLLAMLRFRLGSRLQKTGIALLWEVQDIPALEWLEPKYSLQILRILQEAFTNIIKHAEATEIRVTTDADADTVMVTIADNGVGFEVERAIKGGGKGLPSQMRRAQTVGAEIRWKSDGTGTRFTLRLSIVRSPSALPMASIRV